MSNNDTSAFVRGELTEKVLDFMVILQRLVVEAKQYDSLPADFWAPLESFVDTETYRRCSQDYATLTDSHDEDHGYDNQKFKSTILTWPEWCEIAGRWALSPSLWEYTVMRIAEFTIPTLPGVVYCELEERGGFSGQPDNVHWSNTILLFEFDEAGKLGVMRLGVADYALRPWPVSHPSTGVTAKAMAQQK